MNNWEKVQLKDLVSFNRGVTWSKSQEVSDTDSGAVPVLRIPNIQQHLDLTDVIYLKGVSEEAKRKFAASEGWILMVGSNGNPERVGNCVLINESGDYLFASFLVGIEVNNKTRSDIPFVFHLFNGPEIQRSITDSVQGSTGLRNINLTRLKDYEVLVPPYSQQRKIAKILTTVDNQIEKTEALIDKYQAVKQGMMHDLFTRGVDENGQLRPKREDAPELYKESELGWIPKEWGISTFEEITQDTAPICYGIVQEGPYDQLGVPVVAVNKMYGSFLDLHKASKAIEAKYVRSRVRGNDVLISVKGTTGHATVLPEWFEGNISRGVARIRPRDEVSSSYIRHMLLWPAYRIYLRKYIVGTTREEISIGILKRLFAIIPEPEEQLMIAARLDQIVAQLETIEKELGKLRKIKTALMQDLLTGKVQVTPDSDEAA